MSSGVKTIMAVENSQKQHHHTSGGVVHYCKVCKRRFHCAGALGGHMRSHGVGDHADRTRGGDEVEDDYVVKSYRSAAAEGQKHSYFLRTNTNRFVSNRGGVKVKDHHHHHHDHQDRDNKSVVTSSSSSPRRGGEYCASREEEDLANCLVMLSSNGSFVSSEDDDKAKETEIDNNNNNNNNNNNKGIFQCKACKKVFNSHQALGGHRASHKKVKGCYAAKLDNLNNNNNNLNNSENEYLDAVGPQDSDYSLPSPPPPSSSATALSRKRSRVHQCSICHRIFSSGQALGGHKRCHWLASGMTEATLIQNFQEIAAYDHSKTPPLIFKNPAFTATPPHHQDHHPSPLDLNFPPLLSQPAGGDVNNAAAGKSRFEQETPTRSYLKLWGNQEVSSTNQNHQNSRNNIRCGDDHQKPKMKAPKLSDLKDLKLDGGSASGWLQVGIASTPDIVACHALI